VKIVDATLHHDRRERPMPRTTSTAAHHAKAHANAIEREQERPTPVTVVGLGMMGQALAARFLHTGHPTTVWNRSPGKADRLVEQGAMEAATAAAAIAASPLTIICVSNTQAAREILTAAGDALAGRVVANLTSGTPEQARALADWAAERGVGYLDGVIMAIPTMIGEEETILLYSGDTAPFEAHQSTLTRLGGGTTYLGADAGLAALYDMALLTMMYTLYGGFLHALALVGTAGVSGATLMPYATSILNSILAWLPDTAKQVDAADYATDISSLDVNKAGIDLIVDTSERLGISADVLRPVQALIERRVAEGHGKDGLASLIEALRQPAAGN
jgi:3-hydroxyisobutyrate dehydrogenase-like beta-hydroxyacid dehydrogenase